MRELRQGDLNDDALGKALTVLAQAWAMIFTLFLALAVCSKVFREIEQAVTDQTTEESMKKTPP